MQPLAKINESDCPSCFRAVFDEDEKRETTGNKLILSCGHMMHLSCWHKAQDEVPKHLKGRCRTCKKTDGTHAEVDVTKIPSETTEMKLQLAMDKGYHLAPDRIETLSKLIATIFVAIVGFTFDKAIVSNFDKAIVSNFDAGSATAAAAGAVVAAAAGAMAAGAESLAATGAFVTAESIAIFAVGAIANPAAAVGAATGAFAAASATFIATVNAADGGVAGAVSAAVAVVFLTGVGAVIAAAGNGVLVAGVRVGVFMSAGAGAVAGAGAGAGASFIWTAGQIGRFIGEREPVREAMGLCEKIYHVAKTKLSQCCRLG